MDPSSSFFRIIAGLAAEKEQKMNNEAQQQQSQSQSQAPAQAQRRRSSISDLIYQFSNMMVGGGNEQSRKSIDRGKNGEELAKKEEGLEHARRMSIAILQTIRDSNAAEDPRMHDANQQQKQLEEAIEIFKNLGNEDNEKFDSKFWNDAFNDYNKRMVKQETFKNQPYNRNYNGNNNSNSISNNISGLDGNYDPNTTRFIEIKENENHGIFDSIRSEHNQVNLDANVSGSGQQGKDLQEQINLLQRENLMLRQQVNNLINDNQLLTKSKYELINNTSQAMQEYKRMVKKYNRLLSG